jgi:glycosyltransferase involved in cell wall biosynthesis
MMVENAISVLHIDSEKNWRGGQQQAVYLFEKMLDMGYKTAMVCKPRSAMEQYCHEKSLPCYGLAMHGELDLIVGYRIASLCRKQGFQILHLHSAHALATGLWARLFFKELRLIGVRRVDFHIKKNIFSRFKYKTSLLDTIICVSDGVKNVLLSDWIPREKLVTIHDGVNLHRFDGDAVPDDFKKRLGIPEDHLLIGTVAAMAGHKDYPNLLRAAKKLVDRNDKVTFCAVGDGPDEKSVHDLADRLGLGKRFVFTGFRTDVGNFLKSFDIFVLASYLEGLGTSILDAQAQGLPVVACRTGGIPEIVYDGINGFLVPPRDPDALMAAIEKLVVSPDTRNEFGRNAKETVKAFSIDQTVEKNIDLYRRILAA